MPHKAKSGELAGTFFRARPGEIYVLALAMIRNRGPQETGRLVPISVASQLGERIKNQQPMTGAIDPPCRNSGNRSFLASGRENDDIRPVFWDDYNRPLPDLGEVMG